MLPLISSLHNPKVKDVIRLAKRRERDARRMTVVEGVRESVMALAAGLTPALAFVLDSAVARDPSNDLAGLRDRLIQSGATPVYPVTADVYAKLAYREDSGGIILVVPYPDRRLADLSCSSPPFIVVIEGVEKPGNLGAILRTADAAGVDAVLVCTGATDIYNPNVIRASLGAVFSVPTIGTSSADALRWLRQQQVCIVSTSPQAELPYTRADMAGPVAIAMGSEAHGLTGAWLAAADYRVYIPMRGKVDSLNLSVSAALLMYEVVRQRAG